MNKIISFNLCLGLLHKLTLARTWTTNLEPDVLFLQEAEIDEQMSDDLFFIKDYDFHKTTTKPKSRMVAYIKSSINYKVNISEKAEAISFKTDNKNVIGIYRPFKVKSQKNYMKDLLDFLEENSELNKDTVIVGDFNFDHNKRTDPSYQLHKLYDPLINLMDSLGLKQQISELTWMRVVKGQSKYSTLDHIYTNIEDCITKVVDLNVGDHLAVMIDSGAEKQQIRNKEKRWIRCWKRYDPKALNQILSTKMSKIPMINANQISEDLDQAIMSTLSSLAPTKQIRSDEKQFIWSAKIIELRRRKANLLQKARRKKDPRLLMRCRDLDKDLKRLISIEQRNKIRNKINTADQASLWKAVEQARNSAPRTDIPHELSFKGVKMTDPDDKLEAFREFFLSKINAPTTPKSEPKIETTELKFEEEIFSSERIDKAFSMTKSKNSYGHDLIPMKVLLDAYPTIRNHVLDLFKKVEQGQNLPNKWKTARIIPLFKKGDKSQIENYRPISNLCSLAKIFERCLLLYLREIEDLNNVDLTGKNQYGFKPNHSTIKLSLHLQELISKALENGHLASVVSLDLSAAFDLVDHGILFARMSNAGLPSNFINLIQNWLTERTAYVEVEQFNSRSFKLDKGTVQGSVMGPILFSIFVAPVFNLSNNIIAYADDTYIVSTSNDAEDLHLQTERTTGLVHKFFDESGMIINEQKTEYVIFKRPSIKYKTLKIKVGNTLVANSTELKVVGVIFDEHLSWSKHIDSQINKNKALNYMLRHLNKFFTQSEMLKIVSALVFSKLYYNSAVWLGSHTPKRDQKRLLAASTYTLKCALNMFDFALVSNIDIHKICNRATPTQMSNYVHSTMIHDILSTKVPEILYENLSHNAQFVTRSNKTYFTNKSKNKFGLNSFENRLLDLSKELPSSFSAMSKTQFKAAAKRVFL